MFLLNSNSASYVA
ncbi:hypothetical protein CGLO_18401 [Colletotrichum gloeosporioides Cg-14]|uniref:Uncharacterized protein n=1 Tax=Colletotrichum gloeosporioides (strain Cg-14) TaxID=1237896 RepID=T0KUU7_COLGC|nr:hypothetical protein CGLO_18401 [Colletotrichum gloeosporioides Cg-14]